MAVVDQMAVAAPTAWALRAGPVAKHQGQAGHAAEILTMATRTFHYDCLLIAAPVLMYRCINVSIWRAPTATGKSDASSSSPSRDYAPWSSNPAASLISRFVTAHL